MLKQTTVLFDLDGTLLDTAPDLAHALNQVLVAHQQATLPLTAIRPVASHGSQGLLALGFNISAQDSEFEALRQQLLTAYSDNIANQTTLFAGMEHVLRHLHHHELKWGIVTNKPGWLTEPLLAKVKLPYPPHCIISGDTVARAKPYPDSLLHACTILNCQPQNCLYIGDAERDIQAGKAAGMKTLIAGYGYLATTDQPELWLADGIIKSPLEILTWLM